MRDGGVRRQLGEPAARLLGPRRGRRHHLAQRRARPLAEQLDEPHGQRRHQIDVGDRRAGGEALLQRAQVDGRPARERVQRAVEVVRVVERAGRSDLVAGAQVEGGVGAVERRRPRRLVAHEQLRLAAGARGQPDEQLRRRVGRGREGRGRSDGRGRGGRGRGGRGAVRPASAPPAFAAPSATCSRSGPARRPEATTSAGAATGSTRSSCSPVRWRWSRTRLVPAAKAPSATASESASERASSAIRRSPATCAATAAARRASSPNVTTSPACDDGERRRRRAPPARRSARRAAGRSGGAAGGIGRTLCRRA